MSDEKKAPPTTAYAAVRRDRRTGAENIYAHEIASTAVDAERLARKSEPIEGRPVHRIVMVQVSELSTVLRP